MIMDTVEQDKIRNVVRDTYGKISEQNSCCAPSCCGGSIGSPVEKLGYTPADTAAVPDGANLGLGCGNPIAIASLKPGETVLDLGSGAGFDCFLAAKAVGPAGKVIGVDMTPEMLTKARKNAAKGNYTNVEFRLGEIENLPAADGSVDIIISNCVINLSPDKGQVIRETFRVLKQGGRLSISDIVATAPLPQRFKDDPALLCGCMAGATPVEELRAALADSGFIDISIAEQPASREFIRDWAPGTGIENYVTSAIIQARKP